MATRQETGRTAPQESFFKRALRHPLNLAQIAGVVLAGGAGVESLKNNLEVENMVNERFPQITSAQDLLKARNEVIIFEEAFDKDMKPIVRAALRQGESSVTIEFPDRDRARLRGAINMIEQEEKLEGQASTYRRELLMENRGGAAQRDFPLAVIGLVLFSIGVILDPRSRKAPRERQTKLVVKGQAEIRIIPK